MGATLLRVAPPASALGALVEEFGLVLGLELRVDVMAAESMVARRIDAVAIPRDQGDALREGDRQVGADAGKAAAGQAWPGMSSTRE